MTIVNIYLTSTSQATGWQAQKTEQFVGEDIHLVLPQDHPFRLRQIQTSARKLESLGIEQVQLTGEQWSENAQWAFAMGFSCVNKLTNIRFTGEPALVATLEQKLAVFAWSRQLVNTPPANLVPTQLADAVQTYFESFARSNITCQRIVGEDLAAAGWMGIYNVGKGSDNAPCFFELDYNPSGDSNAKVTACLVGKGITFDSGGYSIKSSEGMFNMKCDMGGAAVVAGALALAIKQGLQARVKLLLCCAENMISGSAFRLGDIITYKNGVSVEIANTDAEGRLVLADGLMAASETKAPLIIDAATLTGAAMLATGGEYTALFSLDQVLAEQTKNIGDKVNEPMWQLPLATWHQKKCPSAFADTANSNIQKGGGMGGASNAAGFLSRFVSQPEGWLHFDLAGAYYGQANSMWAAGATGQGIATIANLLLSNRNI